MGFPEDFGMQGIGIDIREGLGIESQVGAGEFDALQQGLFAGFGHCAQHFAQFQQT